MFRRSARSLVARATPVCLANSGFKYHENKITDADIGGAADMAETMSLTLTRMDEAIIAQKPVKHVQLATTSGWLGVNPNHEYKISKLLPGPMKIEYPDGSSATYFLSGGFANINSAGSIDVNAVEAIPLHDLDQAKATAALAAAEQAAATGTEKEKAVAQIQVQTLEAVIAALTAGAGH